MKRAILVSAGTIAGLAAVLSYSGAEATVASADTSTGGGASAGLGGPAPMASGAAPAPSDSAAAPAPADTAAAPAPSDSAAPPAPATSSAAPAASTPAPAASGSASAPASSAPSAKPSSAAPKPSKTTNVATPTPKPTKTGNTAPTPAPSKTTAKPTPTPTVAAYKDYLGSVAVVPQWGNMQVGIRVQGGKIIDAWAAVFPNADRTSIGKNTAAVPVLRSETIGTTKSQIATVAGATLSSNAWIQSLQAAMTAAGL